MTSVPPALLPVADSFPTQPRRASPPTSAASLIAAMSNPRRESAERAPKLRREYCPRRALSHRDLRANARHRTSRPQLRSYRERDREEREALLAPRWMHVAPTLRPRIPEATTGHHRRGSSRVATVRRRRATEHFRPAYFRARSARLRQASESTAASWAPLHVVRAQRHRQKRRAG